ncbi:hypothetical protein [Sporolactobacillus vineae]|uniref:hypothetical protein n=1 Tax=Sporolactobacillus vineae TaxID=444463 RepID=UPI0002886D2D|nr:hypothetical protein [Sporolactobacillus vineae]
MDLSWLALLACPLMMLPMMLLMMKGHHSDNDHQEGGNELKGLKEQNALLREQLQQLKNKD